VGLPQLPLDWSRSRRLFSSARVRAVVVVAAVGIAVASVSLARGSWWKRAVAVAVVAVRLQRRRQPGQHARAPPEQHREARLREAPLEEREVVAAARRRQESLALPPVLPAAALGARPASCT
jgi:hypothetical protein